MLSGALTQITADKAKMVEVTKNTLHSLIATLKELGLSAPAIDGSLDDVTKVELVWRADGRCYIKVSRGHIVSAVYYECVKAPVRKSRGGYKRKEEVFEQE